MVDIDKNEIFKVRGLNIDIGVAADIKKFLNLFQPRISEIKKPEIFSWAERTRGWKTKYPAVLPEYYNQKDKISAYVFLKTLSDTLNSNEAIVVDIGATLAWTMQSFEVKENQRLVSNFGHAPMGYALPASIGACFALNKKPVICIAGDGGFNLNIQELQTVFHYKLPRKMFVINNRSTGIIKKLKRLSK